jgi:hypothetical protein
MLFSKNDVKIIEDYNIECQKNLLQKLQVCKI